MMEAGSFLCSTPLSSPTPTPTPTPRRVVNHSINTPSLSIKASAGLQKGYKGPKPKKDLIADWVSKNDELVRSLPISVGGVSLLAVLFNRTVSGIAPVADASSGGTTRDVYNFGVILLALFSGRHAYDPAYSDIYLVDHAASENMEIVLPQLKHCTGYLDDDAHTMLKLAARCVRPDHEPRPTMNAVVGGVA